MASELAVAADGRKKRRPRKPKGNQPAFDLAEELERILAVFSHHTGQAMWKRAELEAKEGIAEARSGG